MTVPPTTTAPQTSGGPEPAPGAVDREFTIRARTQGQLVARRFFRHRGALAGMAVLVFIIIMAFTSIGIGPIHGWWNQNYKTPYPILNQQQPTMGVFPPVFGKHPFGQDTIGKDYFAVTMRGAQQSLMIAFVVGLMSTVLGATIGAVAGYFRGATESVLMRLTDLFITVPLLVVAAVVGRTFGKGGVLILGLVLGGLVWTQLARLIRGEFLSLREKEFVEAARAMGASGPRIIFKHILPNTIGTIVVNATLTISAAILLETALSYLGFGVRPPDTSLGLLISDNQTAFQTRPWLFWWPGMLIIAIALSVNFIGDGLRDAFDPKQTRVRA